MYIIMRPELIMVMTILMIVVCPIAGAGQILTDDVPLVRDTPGYYDKALRNPMKGFTANIGHEWATLAHRYIRWNELENHESDGLDRILDVTNQKFANGPENNVKFIPRIYLHWNAAHEKHWPADMVEGDYTSEQFQARLIRLVERLGVAWNNDPRVAFVELGIFGKWGEHHSPTPAPAIQELAGEAFRNAFPDKKVSVRHAWSAFQGFGFGEYWDSWGHYQQMWGHGHRIAELNEQHDLYLSTYIGGEVAYNWGSWQIQPGETPTISVSEPVHRTFMINSIRWLHGTQLRWIAAYDQNDPVARDGAEQLQRVMGYRFRLDSVGFSETVGEAGLRVEFSVTNEGSAIFYYNWPVEVALLDPWTREVVWRDFIADADIRNWAPGSNWTPPQWEEITIWPGQAVVGGWSGETIGWGNPPVSHSVSSTFHPEVPSGEYVLTLAVVDPAGLKPSLRFATSQYWNGGRHPVGLVGIGQPGTGRLPTSFVFDDPALDNSICYDDTDPGFVNIEDDLFIPGTMVLGQNYPNPFNPATTIPFSISASSAVTLHVYNILGQRVAVLLNGEFRTAGNHIIRFDASGLASGLYVYQLVVGGEVQKKQLTLIK